MYYCVLKIDDKFYRGTLVINTLVVVVSNTFVRFPQKTILSKNDSFAL